MNMYDSTKEAEGVDGFCEKTAAETGLFIQPGFTIMERFVK